jgi:two-component sensor histidine kinase
MQILSSLISIETSKIDNPDVKRIFANTELKIQSMAMVHEGLYESEDLAKINFRQYLEKLVPLMIESYANPSLISLELELEDVFITIDSAIPCGLIVSELVINALKHAFRETGKGTITLQLSLGRDGEIVLYFSDDGAGVEKNFDFRKQNTMGLETIFALGESQLHGSVEMNGEGGVSCTLKFKDASFTEKPRTIL